MFRVKFAAILLMAGMVMSGFCADVKHYEVKSGIVEYAISGGGSMMGVTTQTKGKSKLVFKDYGNLELHDDTSESTVMGKTQKDHEMFKIDHGKMYGVDFEQKIIVEYSPQMFAQMNEKDLTKMGKEMFESMGGKIVGHEKILGYECEVMEVMGTKSWIHKGVILKSEADIMGMKHLQVATSAKFDVAVADEAFQLPAFEIKTLNELTKEGAGGEEIPTMPTPEELKEMQEMLKNFGK